MSKLKEEFLDVLPPTIFFLIALHIVALIRRLMLEGSGLPVMSVLSVTIAALVLGKAVLIADHLPGVNRYPEKPLIYNVLWKTAIYMVVSVVIHYLEHLVDFWRQTGSIVAGNRELLAKIVWQHFLSIQILLVVMIFSYCVIRELVRVLGRRRVMEIFFGPVPPSIPAQSIGNPRQ